MRSRLLLFASAALLLASCGNLLEPAAAVVNGNKITTDDVKIELDRFKATSRYAQLATQGDEGALERDVEQTYLSLLIRLEVLRGEAEERGLEVTEKEITDEIDRLKEEEFSSEGDFQEALKEEGLELDQLRLRVEVQELEEEVKAEVTKDVVPTEEELQSYYDEHIEDFQEVRAQHILVSSGSLSAQIATQLQNAPDNKIDALFEKLAARHSEDPSNADKGGDLGWSKPGDYVAPFAEAITTLEIGQISNPVQTEFGRHVIRVTGRRVEPFERVRAAIETELSGDEAETVWQKWVVDAFEEADVRVNSRYGEFDVETQLVTDPGAEDVPGAEVPSAPVSPTPGQ